MARQAVLLNHREPEFFLTLARLEASVGSYENARKTLRVVLENDLAESWHKEARELNQRIEVDAQTGTPSTKPYLPDPRTAGFKHKR